jgi:hypothetical protein
MRRQAAAKESPGPPVGRRQSLSNRGEMTVGIHPADKYIVDTGTSEEQLSSNENTAEGVDMVMYLLPSGVVSPVTKASPSTLWWRRRAAILPGLQVAQAEPMGSTGARSDFESGRSLGGAQDGKNKHEDSLQYCGRGALYVSEMPSGSR